MLQDDSGFPYLFVGRVAVLAQDALEQHHDHRFLFPSLQSLAGKPEMAPLA